MNRKYLVVLLGVVAAVAVAAAAMSFSEDGDDRLKPSYADGMPDTYVFDGDKGTIDAGDPVDWRIFDLYHGFCNDDRGYTEYSGYELKSARTVKLDPGIYRITADGNEFTAFMDGYVERTFDWTYDMDGVKYDVSAETEFTMSEFIAGSDANKDSNKAKSEVEH